MQNNTGNQALYWALAKPLKYMGLTIDEWLVMLVGVIPGIFLLNGAKAKLGCSFLLVGIGLCYCFKKGKKLSEHFLLKSYLTAKGILPAPKFYPALLSKEVGK